MGFEQCLSNSQVARLVALELVEPKIRTAGRGRRAHATLMPVPKAAMDEDRGAEPRQGHVRSTRQVRPVQAEPKPQSVKRTPQGKLRLGVESRNLRHDLRARLRIDDIGHPPLLA